VSFLKAPGAGPKAVDVAHDLVPRDDSMFQLGEVPFDHVQIRPADAASPNLHSNFPRPRFRIRKVHHLERACFDRRTPMQHHRLHGYPSV
jgi:hypothetical protein